MNTPVEFVGTWEEIVGHSAELAGRIVRVTVVSSAESLPVADSGENRSKKTVAMRLPDLPLATEEISTPVDLPRSETTSLLVLKNAANRSAMLTDEEREVTYAILASRF